MEKIKSLFALFWSMMNVGLFTFGGGYAMISLLDNEFVVRKQWIGSEEFMDLVTIAESTPGPIAVNCSTYIGYKRAGFLGAVFGTLGMCLPTFTIIYVISLFFNRFLAIAWVAAAFRGIQACVIFLILSAGIKLFKKIKKSPFNIFAMSVTFVLMVTFSLLSVTFSSIFYILIFAFLGFVVYGIGYLKDESDKKEERV